MLLEAEICEHISPTVLVELPRCQSTGDLSPEERPRTPTPAQPPPPAGHIANRVEATRPHPLPGITTSPIRPPAHSARPVLKLSPWFWTPFSQNGPPLVLENRDQRFPPARRPTPPGPKHFNKPPLFVFCFFYLVSVDQPIRQGEAMDQQLVDDITVVPGTGRGVSLQVGGQEPPGLVCRTADQRKRCQHRRASCVAAWLHVTETELSDFQKHQAVSADKRLSPLHSEFEESIGRPVAGSLSWPRVSQRGLAEKEEHANLDSLVLMMVESWLAASQFHASFWLSSPPYWSLMHLDQNKHKQPVNGLMLDLSGPMLGGLMSQNHQLQPARNALTSMCGSSKPVHLSQEFPVYLCSFFHPSNGLYGLHHSKSRWQPKTFNRHGKTSGYG